MAEETPLTPAPMTATVLISMAANTHNQPQKQHNTNENIFGSKDMFMDPRPQGYLARKHASGKEGIDRHDDIRTHADNSIVECL